jgi:Uma2 family endonuclease
MFTCPSIKKSKADEDITTVVQPDLCVICDPDKVNVRGCIGAPDWVIEILSPYTFAKDLREKFDVYEEAGVNEYWVVHPQEQTVLVYIRRPTFFTPTSNYSPDLPFPP